MARQFASASSQWLSYSAAALSADPMTMAAWIYPDSAHDGTIMAITDEDQAAGRWQLVTNAASSILQAIKQNDAGTQTQTVSTVNTYTTSQWSHAAAVFTNTSSRTVILNADFANEGNGTTTVTNETSASMTSIGARKLSNAVAVFFNGRIAHAAIWNVALSDAEITRLYNNGIGLDPRSVRPDALVAYWPLLNNDGDQDYWGNFHLTASGSPTYAQHPPVLMRSRPKYVILGSAAPSIATIEIAGTRQVGNTLTCNATSSPSGATFAYQWYMADDIDGLNGTPISGATSQTYALTYANLGAAQKLYEGLDANGEAFIACGATPTLAAVEGSETVSSYVSITEAAVSAPTTSPFESLFIR